MANKVLLKKSSVSAKVPLIADLDYGEVALNYNDSKLYFKKSDGTTVDHFPSATATSTLSNKTLLNPIVTAATNTVALQINRVSGQPSIKSGGTDGYLIMDNTQGLGGALGLNWYSPDNVVIALGGGDVGVGTNTPDSKLTVDGAVNSASYPVNVSLQNSTTAFAIGVGSGLSFRGKYQTAAGQADYAAIGGYKENATDGNYAGYLSLMTRASGSSQLTEHVRIDSTGKVVFGTGTPSGKVDIVGSIGTVRIETTGNKLSFTRNGANYISAAGGSSASISYDAPVHYFNSGDGATTRLTLDDSGNLSLGALPSAWGSSYRALQIGNNGLMSGVNDDSFYLTSNVYYSGTNWTYTSTNTAALLSVNNGVFTWNSAVSGSAGATASLTQTMLLTASGQLGLGSTVTAPTSQIDLGSTFYSGTPSTIAQNINKITLYSTSNTAYYGFGISTGALNITAGEPAAKIRFMTGGATERVVIAADGKVGIDVASPIYKLHVNGSFAATTKSFVIPHPTKENKFLRYGSLEGPENGVYVRGRLTNGNTIVLPDYWTKLVDPDSITVELTPIGSHQKLYVKDIADNTVVVGNENVLSKSVNCFYTVYAERVDVEKLEVEIDGN